MHLRCYLSYPVFRMIIRGLKPLMTHNSHIFNFLFQLISWSPTSLSRNLDVLLLFTFNLLSTVIYVAMLSSSDVSDVTCSWFNPTSRWIICVSPSSSFCVGGVGGVVSFATWIYGLGTIVDVEAVIVVVAACFLSLLFSVPCSPFSSFV